MKFFIYFVSDFTQGKIAGKIADKIACNAAFSQLHIYLSILKALFNIVEAPLENY